MSNELPHAEWLITTLLAPMTFNRGQDEVWPLNPVRRYLFNRQHAQKFTFNIDQVSTLAGSPLYHPLRAGRSLSGKRIFVERFRDRGLGDLLFLTGPFAFMHSVTGGTVKIYPYAWTDRGAVLQSSPYVENGTCLFGPTHYDDFWNYDYQWLINSVTESTCESDQLNVYDALYDSIGLNPAQIDPKFKRPSVTIESSELADLASFFHSFWSECAVDARHTGYYVVAPFTHSPLRQANFSMWLEVIPELARRRPVFIIGQANEPVPDTDLSIGQFVAKVDELNSPQIANLINKKLRVRFIMALISQATAFVGLDSGPLYIAQGCRVPAVSVWGPHDPGVRLGYDPDYMDLAVWEQEGCSQAPCFAFRNFPASKCPLGPNQQVCEVFKATTADAVLAKVDLIERKRLTAVFRSLKPNKANETCAQPAENTAP